MMGHLPGIIRRYFPGRQHMRPSRKRDSVSLSLFSHLMLQAEGLWRLRLRRFVRMLSRPEHRRRPLSERGSPFSRNIPDYWLLTDAQVGVIQRVYKLGNELGVPSSVAFARKPFRMQFLLSTEKVGKVYGAGPDASSECWFLSEGNDGNGPEDHLPVVLLRPGFFYESVLKRLVALQHEFVHLYGRDHTETWGYDDDALTRYERRFPKHASKVRWLREWKHGSYSDPEYLKQGLPMCECSIARRTDLAHPELSYSV